MSEGRYSRVRFIGEHLNAFRQLYLTAIILIGIGICGFLIYRHAKDQQFEKESWPLVEALIMDARQQLVVKARPTREFVSVELTLIYHADGKDRHEQRTIEFDKPVFPKWSNLLEPGRTILIHVSPEDPNRIWVGPPASWTEPTEPVVKKIP